MLSLPNVELIAIRGGGDSSDHFVRALKVCMSLVNFGKVTFFTNEAVSAQDGIDVVEIPAMDLRGYSRFCIQELNQRTVLPFCLLIQSDGFLTNPSAWRERFLRYDYIGAPWAAEMVCEADRVGNGGFSLRSRKFLEVCERFPFPIEGNEDHLLCRSHRAWMVEQGIQFAPLHIAAKFSREQYLSEFTNSPSSYFGFHGWAPGREAYKFLIYGCNE